MELLQGFALLLLCQSAGEVLVRLTAAPLPAPVLGAGLLLVLLRWTALRAPVAAAIRPASTSASSRSARPPRNRHFGPPSAFSASTAAAMAAWGARGAAGIAGTATGAEPSVQAWSAGTITVAILPG